MGLASSSLSLKGEPPFYRHHIEDEKERLLLLLLPCRKPSVLAGVGKAATSPFSAKLKTPNSPEPVEAVELENPRSIAELLLPAEADVLVVLLFNAPHGRGLVHDVEEEEVIEEEATEDDEQDGGGAKARAPPGAGRGESRLRDSAALRTPSKRKSTLEIED